MDDVLIFKSGDALVTINEEAHWVKVDGENVHLSHREFHLLCVLAGANGRVVSQQYCLDTLYPIRADQTSDQAIYNLVQGIRRKLGKAHRDTRNLVSAVRGQGYKITSCACGEFRVIA